MSRRVSWWAELLGSADRDLVRVVREQLRVSHDAAVMARRLVRGEVSTGEALERVDEIEQEGDAARDEVFGMLSELLTTPMDREDLYRLSRSMEDVVNNLRDFVRECHLLDVGDDELLVPVVEAIASALDNLDEPVAAIADDLPTAALQGRAVHREINEVRRAYQQGLAALYQGPLEMATLKRRDLLSRLDVIGLRLGEAVGALSDGAMKRGR